MQRQTRAMERSNSMRGKRSLDASDGSGGGGGDDEQPERKRPALASVIVEALKVDSLQKLCSSLEPILRRVVRHLTSPTLLFLPAENLCLTINLVTDQLLFGVMNW